MNLYKINEVREIQHYQVPKVLFKHPAYEDLTNDTRLAYSMLLDRLELSRLNNWTNENNEVFLIYTREEMAKDLNIKSKTTITKVFKQLNDYGLIQEERQGLNKPNRIYVAHLQPLPIETERCKKTPVSIGNTGSTENVLQEVYGKNSGSTKNGLQEVQNSDTNNTDIIKTNMIDIKIDRFNLLFNSNKENLGGNFDRNDDTKGFVLVEYFLKSLTERQPSDIGLTKELEKEYIELLEKIEIIIQPKDYEFFYSENNEKFRQFAYLMYGVIYDILTSPHKRYLEKLDRTLIMEVLERVDLYQQEIDNIYAYFKASLIRELRK